MNPQAGRMNNRALAGRFPRWRWAAAGLLTLICAMPLIADAEEQPWRVSKAALPLAELPAHILAADGAITAHADFDDPVPPRPDWPWLRNKAIPIYVVNRTDEDLGLAMQDGSAYFMLEVEVNGQWQRAQTHVFSDCGNSFWGLKVPPGHFVVVSGGVRMDGEPARGRFRRVYGVPEEIVTNVGPAALRPLDIEAARVDGLAVATADAETAAKVARGELNLTAYDWMGERRAVIRLKHLATPAAAEGLVSILEVPHNKEITESVLVALSEIPPEVAVAMLPRLQALAPKHNNSWFRVALTRIQLASRKAAAQPDSAPSPDPAPVAE